MMGQLTPSWKEGESKYITFCVTEDCNLQCKYCYMTGKNKLKKMTFDIAKKAIDYILSDRNFFNEKAVVWDFIGGEPFLEIELIDKICDYIKLEMYRLNHPWFENYRFSFSTNGLLYSTPKVQEYIKKNISHLSVGISIDGNKVKHDMQRIKKDGSGSYDEVAQNIPLWQKQFPGAMTKATFSHDDLPYLKDSIISLWNNGINIVAANVIFEDVWHDDDDIIFENQLRELGDYILENEKWKEYSVRFFDPNIGFPVSDEVKKRNFCGTGNMIAIDCEGNFFPCVRFYDFSLDNKEGRNIGNIYEGINYERLRPFKTLSLELQSKEECTNCNIASGCAWCTAYNYDIADTDTIYQRSTAICKMHKANVRASEYFWNKFRQHTGIKSKRDEIKELHNKNIKYLQFITSDNIIPHCNYHSDKKSKKIMDNYIFEKGLDFARENNFKPVILGNYERYNIPKHNDYYYINNLVKDNNNNSIDIIDNSCNIVNSNSDICILLMDRENIKEIYNNINKLVENYNRINLILQDIEKYTNEDIIIYDEQLDKINSLIVNKYKEKYIFELNVLTDLLYSKQNQNCDAGESTYALAPNGKIYMCPAFYFYNPNSYIGNLEDGVNIKNPELLSIDNSPICKVCDVFSCSRCKFLNKKITCELNTPSHIQCKINHIQRNKSRELMILLKQEGMNNFPNELEEICYLDPIQII
jgi:radical SAM peptide maturase (CXXX-repeat target family)/CXXX repeat peptide maturase